MSEPVDHYTIVSLAGYRQTLQSETFPVETLSERFPGAKVRRLTPDAWQVWHVSHKGRRLLATVTRRKA